jgi:hypothetical protein
MLNRVNLWLLDWGRTTVNAWQLRINAKKSAKLLELFNKLAFATVHSHDGFVNAVCVVAGVNFFSQSSVAEYITDFSHVCDKVVPGLQPIQRH